MRYIISLLRQLFLCERSVMRGLQIAIVSQPNDVVQAGIIRGVLHETRRLGWTLRLYAPDNKDFKGIRTIGIDGIIASTVNEKAFLMRQNIPLVFTEQVDRIHVRSRPVIRIDDKAAGRMAAEYFMERSFSNFAVWSSSRSQAFIDRRRGFQEALKKAGYNTFADGPPTTAHHAHQAETEEPAHLKKWLLSLPKPCAVFAESDFAAYRICQTCAEIGLHIPEELAVMGVDNIPSLCELSIPPLSSIPQPTEQIGKRAVQVLKRCIENREIKESFCKVPPLPIITRQSTDIFAVQDPVVRKALRLIGERALMREGVYEIAEHLPVTRRTLERRFRKSMGRSLHQEIERVRLNHALMLLSNHNMRIAEVASACGYSNATLFGKAFTKRFGKTPSAWRENL